MGSVQRRFRNAGMGSCFGSGPSILSDLPKWHMLQEIQPQKFMLETKKQTSDFYTSREAVGDPCVRLGTGMRRQASLDLLRDLRFLDKIHHFAGERCGGVLWATDGTRSATLTRSPSSALLPFLGEGSPTLKDCRKKGTLTLSSLLEDLVKTVCPLVCSCA